MASTTAEIKMPQMGESVTEGTVLEWHKQVGDPVEAEETVVEVSTDKVDAEVPAPTDGVITEILVGPDETVPVGTVLAQVTVGAEAGDGNGAGPDDASAQPSAAERPAAAEGAHGRAAEVAAERTPDRSAPSATAPPTASAELVDVTLPQMGESVTEGTVLEWRKQAGDPVEAEETVVEVSTDKVDAEVPAPAAG